MVSPEVDTSCPTRQTRRRSMAGIDCWTRDGVSHCSFQRLCRSRFRVPGYPFPVPGSSFPVPTIPFPVPASLFPDSRFLSRLAPFNLQRSPTGDLMAFAYAVRRRVVSLTLASALAPAIVAAQQTAAPPPQTGPKVGDVAPDFSLPGATRYGLLRDPVTLSSLKGKTVVLAFFFKARTRG